MTDKVENEEKVVEKTSLQKTCVLTRLFGFL